MLKSILAGFALLAGSVAAQPAAPRGGQPTAIVGATVLPMTGTERLADQTVIVSGDRILAVGPRARIKVPAGARVVDGRGQVLMPGLVDMHIHLAPTPAEPGDPAQRALAVMLAHGVTTARGMAGSPANLAVRQKLEAGEVAGPRLYAAAPAMHDQNTQSVDQARDAVAKAKAAGFDLIKSHQISDPAVWQAVQDEARKAGLPVGGHVSNDVGFSRAIAANQQIEHLDGMMGELLPAGAPEKAIPFGQVPPPPVVHALMKLPDSAYRALAAKAAAAKSWHVPTLSLFEKMIDLQTPTDQLLADPDMRFVPPAALKQWSDQRAQMQQLGYSAADAEAFRAVRRRLANALNAAGVAAMAGSDTAQAFHIWGPGLHQEIRSLVKAGLTPMQALRSATVVPRNYFRSLPNGGSTLGWKADFGTVESGARADLILLPSDPTANLAALDRPNLVIAGGRVYDRPALDAMLAGVIAALKAPAKGAAVPTARQIYVMRHLQKAADAGDDPPLSAEGSANAAKLADLLGKQGIKAIFATPTRRAMETAQPLARRLGLDVTTYDPRNPQALVQAVGSVPGNVLVVGHSNTVPALLAAFGGSQPAPIGENDYGTIFQLGSGSPKVVTLGLPAN